MASNDDEVLSRADRAPEPEALRRGKMYEAQVRGRWQDSAEGNLSFGRYRKTDDGRRGFIDIHVDLGPDDNLVAVVEVKDLSWDAMSHGRLVRTCDRIAELVGKYIDAELENGREVSPGVVFRQRPSIPGRFEEIEGLLDAYGIPVDWEDESIDARRKRSGLD